MLPWWVRLSIRMLPRTFRDQFGADLAESIAALAAAARASGGRRRQLAYLTTETAGLWRLAISRRTNRHMLGTPQAHGASMTAGLFDELRWAVRHARRRPVFSLAVVLTLSVSIGGAASAFGIADAVLWRPLPFDDAERLFFIWEESEREGQPAPSRVTGSRYAAWRDADTGVASISLFGAAAFTVDDEGGASSIRGVRVSANYFDTLGIRAALGRTFVADDEVPGNDRVVILSHRVWQDRFGRRPDAIGGTFRLNGQPYVIVGVMPPATFPAWPVNPAIVTIEADARDVWVPIPRRPELDQSGRAHVFGVLARLAPGVSETGVAARLNLTSDSTAVDPHRARLTPLREQLTAGARAPLLVLGAAALAVLLIACANLAALYASLFETRRAELAVRTAIGAGSARLARQLLLETSLLATCGAAGGLLIAGVALGAIPGAVPAAIPLLTAPSVDWRVFGAAIALALLATSILTGWPVVRVIAAAPAPGGVAPRPRMTVYRTLVVAQVAITVALASAAGLLMRSLDSVRMRDPGFSAERVLVADIGLPSSAPEEPWLITVAEQSLLDAIAALPRVRAVATAYDHPLEANWSESPTVVGDAASEERRQQVELRIVSPGYFDALGVEIFDGRPFTARDGIDAPGVVVVNEAYAREIGGKVIGRRIRTSTPRFNFAAAPEEFEVVGIAGNERVRGLEEAARPAFYLSTRQFPQTSFVMLVRTVADPMLLAADVRAAVRAAGAGITFDRPTSLEAVLDGQLAPRQVTTGLVSGLTVAALILAALGMYGLLAVLVESQKREIGVRLAIGATPASVSRHVMIGSLRNAAGGVGLGCAAALLAGQLLQSLLVDVSARDPINLAMAAGALLAIAACASVLPAVRAARIDPVTALRAD